MPSMFFNGLQWNNSLFLFGEEHLFAYFVSRTISTVVDHMQEHISSDFSFSLTALIPKLFQVFQVSRYPD